MSPGWTKQDQTLNCGCFYGDDIDRFSEEEEVPDESWHEYIQNIFNQLTELIYIHIFIYISALKNRVFSLPRWWSK